MSLLGNLLQSGNHDSILGTFGKKGQKWTDPLSWVTGGKWADWTSTDIPRASNQVLSKVMTPFDRVDETINPVRRYVPGVDKLGDVVRDKPASAIGTVVGGIFAAPAIGGALGAGGAGGAAGGAGGATAGGGGAGLAEGAGALGYGGGVQSSVLPGIFGGANVGSGTGAGAGIFGGGAGTGSITGAGGMFGAGGGNLFGSGGLNPMQQQLMQQANKSFGGGQPQQRQQNRPLDAAQDQTQQAYLSQFQPLQLTPAVRAQILADALNQYKG